jgi:hypothetical protein
MRTDKPPAAQIRPNIRLSLLVLHHRLDPPDPQHALPDPLHFQRHFLARQTTLNDLARIGGSRSRKKPESTQPERARMRQNGGCECRVYLFNINLGGVPARMVSTTQTDRMTGCGPRCKKRRQCFKNVGRGRPLAPHSGACPDPSSEV